MKTPRRKFVLVRSKATNAKNEAAKTLAKPLEAVEVAKHAATKKEVPQIPQLAEKRRKGSPEEPVSSSDLYDDITSPPSEAEMEFQETVKISEKTGGSLLPEQLPTGEILSSPDSSVTKRQLEQTTLVDETQKQQQGKTKLDEAADQEARMRQRLLLKTKLQQVGADGSDVKGNELETTSENVNTALEGNIGTPPQQIAVEGTAIQRIAETGEKESVGAPGYRRDEPGTPVQDELQDYDTPLHEVIQSSQEVGGHQLNDRGRTMGG